MMQKTGQINLELEAANAKIADLERLIANLAHSINGQLSSSFSSLRWLLEENKNLKGGYVITNAMKSGDLIRRTVKAICYSSGGGIDDFIYDATHIDSKSTTLHSIIYDSIFMSLENVCDGWNFGKIQQRFIEDLETFKPMKMAFDKLEPNNIKQLGAFCEKYFFDCTFNIEGLDNFVIADEKESATKLFILFQEIIFNTVKYSGLVDRKQRYLNIKIKQAEDFFDIEIINSASSRGTRRIGGLGHHVIEKMINLMEAEYKVVKDEKSYCVRMKIPIFWQHKK